MIDVRRLRLLRELDNRGTVAAVATALHLTPSAVSQQLAALAREAGVPLLDPIGRRVRLTPAAKVLLRHADEIFAQLERAEADLAAFDEGRTGKVTIAAFATAIIGIVAPAIQELRVTHPGLDITVVDVQPPGCYDLLAGGELDLAVDFVTTRPADGQFEMVRLLDDLFDVALPRDHPLAGLDAVPLGQLADEDFIASLPGSACLKIMEAACGAAGFAPRIRHRSDDFIAVFGLIAAGCGIGMIPRLAGLGSTDRVVLRPMVDPPIRRLSVSLRRGSGQAPHLAVVLRALKTAASAAALEPPDLPIRGLPPARPFALASAATH
ncbi:LysR family transcriptional regulator [Frankia sp. CNm7]|uniref:LysR family transcriptional regulator n=1 Tax=Frankia nepalensis TaxID=1836974 RepID=A0A937USE3_9ACTN|nr:LysR family transcriptional regulator [Frankia nepalensis]MBL7499577.1 LysR family transcriptional regulator [Frankia nepalensis]MBL7513066.1 LysR family transcriptional regulator [Frankia nepalensis]MBL7522902.1 LysR family transcriptional regulator [Frankia nepalensis]MBL7633779.1 LysR family transcriptional regulator [Frankia nepalensis]